MHEGMGDPRARTEERRQKPTAVQSDHNNNHLRPPPPPPQEPQQCPRCDSFNTKFCYYNNYSLSQPRFFCKACRRYWTRGGTLRNVPVGGGCRKGKRTKIAPSSSSSSSTTSSSATTAEPSSSLLQTQTQTLPLLHRQHEKLQSFPSPAISPNLGISLPPTAALRLPGNNLISPPSSYVGGGGGSGGLLSSLSSWIHHHPTSSLNQHHVPASSFNQTLSSDFGGGGEGGSPSTNFSPYNLGLSQLQGYDLSAYGQQIHHRLQQQQQQRQHQQFQEVEYFHHQVENSKDNIKNNLDQQPPTMCPLDQGGLMNSSQSSRLTDWNRSFNPANNANLNPTTPSDGVGFWNITTVGNSDAGAAGSSLNQTHWTDLP